MPLQDVATAPEVADEVAPETGAEVIQEDTVAASDPVIEIDPEEAEAVLRAPENITAHRPH